MKFSIKSVLRYSLALALMSACAAPLWAQDKQDAAVKKALEAHMEDGIKIDSVTKTPYAGLYEVRIGNDIVYTDKGGQYLFVGHVLDSATHQDFTHARLEAINKIDFKNLPLDKLAIKTVVGNGKRVFASFEDPNCGYCKRLSKTTLKEMNNYTLYVFPFPILSEDSTNKVKNIWCSADRSKAWKEWMQDGKEPAAAPASCNAPIQEFVDLGKKLGVTGTPTMFFADGSRFPGAVDAKTLEAKLDSVK